MDGRKYQRKSGIKRTLVMLLALVMLASVCFPAMRVNAEETLECTCGTENETHSEGCPKYVAPQNDDEGNTAECTCGTENETHSEGCPKYVAPQNDDEGDTKECTCNAENGVHTEGCPKYVAPLNGGEGDTKECTCNAENGVHAEGCPKYVAPLNGGEGDTKECTCNAENGVHTEGCPKYVAPQNGGEGDTKECNCNAENGVHAETCPMYVEPQNDDEDPSMSDTAKNYLSRIEDLKGQIENLDPDASDYEDQWRRIFDDLIIIQRDVSTDWEEYILSDDEFETICYAAEALKNQLGDPYDAATYAAKPQMKYYNKNNKLAYDVAKANGKEGHDDSLHTYVASVTLGGVEVLQADSNRSYDLGSRVGKKLSSYYGDLNTDGAVTNKTLVITPATGYYVTRVVVACCDGGAPYKCGTWLEEKAFDQEFSVSAGGALSVVLQSSAFGHGGSLLDESKLGVEQYFILIQVAPVPTPLYIEYNYGTMGEIMGDDLRSSVFADPSQWTGVGGSNNIGRGSIHTKYTRYRYEYEAGKPGDVAQWKHFANTVTDEAKKAAADKGYYFAGWEATYYTECNDEYNFNNKYSDETTPYDESDQVNLITNVRLVAQWAPIPMKVTKTVTGLPEGYSNSNSYGIQVLKDGLIFGNKQTLTVNGNGKAEVTLTDDSGYVLPVTPGHYTVVEDTCNPIDYNGKSYYVNTSSTDLTVTASGAASEYTVNVTNAYSDAQNSSTDPTFIVVQKVFEGITKDQIPANFTITVTNGNTTYTLTKNPGDGIQFTESEDGLTWTWRIMNADVGTYTISESDADVPGYTLSKTVNGTNNSTVTVDKADIDLTIKTIHRGNDHVFKVKGGQFFAISRTGNQAAVVITENTLSASQRSAIENHNEFNGGNWKKHFLFYSFEQLKDAPLVIGGYTFKYDSQNGTVTIPDSGDWNEVALGTYDITLAQNPEALIRNTYTPSTTSVTVTKTVSGNMGDQGKGFKFTASLNDASMAGITYDLYQKNDAGTYDPVSGGTGTIETKTYDFTLKHDQKIVFRGVKIGAQMTVTETTDYSVTYKIDSGNVTNGKAAQFTVGNSGNTVEFNNTKNATIDTGIVTDSIPYILLLTMAVIGAGVLLNKRRVF